MPPVWLLTLVVKSGLTGKAARIASWGIVFVAAVLLIFAAITATKVMWGSHNDAVADKAIEDFNKDLSLDAANRVIAADRAANANAADVAIVEQRNEKELNDAASTGNNRTVGVLERMRDQQQSGRR